MGTFAIVVLALANDEFSEVFHENSANTGDQSSPFARRRAAQNTLRRVTMTMPDVEEPSAPIQLPDLPAGWDERQVNCKKVSSIFSLYLRFTAVSVMCEVSFIDLCRKSTRSRQSSAVFQTQLPCNTQYKERLGPTIM